VDHGLTSTQVCELTGLSYRRLDYWVRSGYVTPLVQAAGSGSSRLFAPGVVDEIFDILDRLRQCPFGHPGV